MAIVTTQQTGKDVKVIRLVSTLVMIISIIPLLTGNESAMLWFLGGAALNVFARVLNWWKYK